MRHEVETGGSHLSFQEFECNSRRESAQRTQAHNAGTAQVNGFRDHGLGNHRQHGTGGKPFDRHYCHM